jgi:ubiquinone/menaquinone biosynthesis C-methylase UbiE
MKSQKSIIGLRTPSEWNAEWQKWFAIYSKGNPRLGKWIKASYPIHNARILEIAAGSGRESRYLAKYSKEATCVDFSPEAVFHLGKSGLPNNMSVAQADAFELNFPDQHFDLTFHKGFWILFSENSDIEKLLAEQFRVTKKTMLAIVQNGLNLKQVAEAHKKAEYDPLFMFRFFEPNELLNLSKKTLGEKASVRIRKYGMPSLSKRISFLGSSIESLETRIYSLLPWTNIECAVLEIQRNQK